MSGIAGVGMVAIGPDNGHGYYVPDTSASPLVLLVRHLRQTIKTTLPEILEIPETIDAHIVDMNTGLLINPIIVMIGKAPRPGDAAVGEQLQILTYDFVYILESVQASINDVQDYVRNQLVKLQHAFVYDFRQGGFCNATRVQQVPIDHENQYKNFFAAQAQQVTALVLQMEFDVIERLLP